MEWDGEETRRFVDGFWTIFFTKQRGRDREWTSIRVDELLFDFNKVHKLMFNECMRPAATNGSFIIMMVAAFQGLHTTNEDVFRWRLTEPHQTVMMMIEMPWPYSIYIWFIRFIRMQWNGISFLFHIFISSSFFFCCRRRRHYATLLALSKVHQNPLIIKKKKNKQIHNTIYNATDTSF